ncbi:hypothetical protein AAG570_001370 [Ranatra chinensis]|uniref:Uncharacterized protein n=1 Tax=Ranatra chinensis TaxID=642074 RepID=A0ABD0YCE1_9HEMI
MDWLPDLSLSGLRNWTLGSYMRRRRGGGMEESPAPPRPQPQQNTTPPQPTAQHLRSQAFRKCESATFHLDGATYTIGKPLQYGITYNTVTLPSSPLNREYRFKPQSEMLDSPASTGFTQPRWEDQLVFTASTSDWCTRILNFL